MSTLAFSNDMGMSLGSIYMDMMRYLPDATKLEIINLLSASLLKKEKKPSSVLSDDKTDLYTCFRGDWGNGMSTDEYCEELRRDLLPAKEIDL